MTRREEFFGGKLVINEPFTPCGPAPRLSAGGLTIVSRAAVDAAREAIRAGALLPEVMGAAQRAAAGLPPKQPRPAGALPRTGVLPDGRMVEQEPGGLWRPVVSIGKTEEDGMDVVWSLPGGGRAWSMENPTRVLVSRASSGLADCKAPGVAAVAVASALVCHPQIDQRPTSEQLIDALRLVPPDADAGVVYAARKGALLVLGMKGPRGTDGTHEDWFVAAQDRTWRTDGTTASEVRAMGDRGVSVVEIRQFMEAGGAPGEAKRVAAWQAGLAVDETPLAVAIRERDAARRAEKLADEGGARCAASARDARRERDELRQKLRDRDEDVKRVAVESYRRGHDNAVLLAETQRLTLRAEVDRLGVSLAKAKQEALRVNAEQAKKLSEANAHIDMILDSEKRLLEEIRTLEQRPLCRTVTTVVRCAGGKVLERTVETQVVTGEQAAQIARADAARATTEAADLLKSEAFRVRALPQLEWKDLDVGQPGQVLVHDSQGTPLEVVDVVRVGHAGGKSLPVRHDEQVPTGAPAVDMARVEAVVRQDLEATRNLRRENVLAVGLILAVMTFAGAAWALGPGVSVWLSGLLGGQKQSGDVLRRCSHPAIRTFDHGPGTKLEAECVLCGEPPANVWSGSGR